MFVILWEFEVKPGSAGGFENVYGPNGAWVRLFQRDPHFRGNQLLRDPTRPLFYFTLDFWDSETDYHDFLNAYRAAYEELDRYNEGLTLQERNIGSFSLSLPISDGS